MQVHISQKHSADQVRRRTDIVCCPGTSWCCERAFEQNGVAFRMYPQLQVSKWRTARAQVVHNECISHTSCVDVGFLDLFYCDTCERLKTVLAR
jgi:hypothetical protein